MKPGRFIRFRIRQIAAYIACMLIFSIVLLLYGIPLSAMTYPLILCSAFGLCVFAGEYGRNAMKCRELREITEYSMDLPPAGEAYEEEYQRIIALIMEAKERNEQKLNNGYIDMVDYYSTWAHQIKTPIASMRLRLQSEDSELSRKLRHDLNDIERYVEMVMTYLRLDSKDSDLVIREVELDDIIRPAIRKFSGDFINKGLKLEYSAVSAKVITDEKWLAFVLEQILSNAVKYTNEGSISIFMKDGRLCIKDTGIGIAPEDIPRIFDKGYTGFNGREDRKASGIGLYLCKKTCDRLGHDISAESMPGSGTEICIDFGPSRLEIE